MKKIKHTITALGLAALGYLGPSQAQGALTLLPATDEAVTSNQLHGAARTSDSRLGLGASTFFQYNDDLSSGSATDFFTPNHVHDAGSWNDDYILVHSGGTVVELFSIANSALAFDGSSVNGTAVKAVSSMFEYNGSPHFAAIDGNTDTVQFFEWGSNTPVASGPHVGSGYTGLEAAVDGPVTDLAKVPLLVSRDTMNFEDSKIDQYFDNTIVASYTDGWGHANGVMTDLSYDAASEMLTASYDLTPGREQGRGMLARYDFAGKIVPEPAETAAAMGLAALAAAALYRARRKK